jgi:multidrug efflux pump subunit AcrB
VDPVKLAYYKIPITAFQKIIANENENTTAGLINLKSGKYQIRIPGEIKDIREAYNLVVHSFDNKPVYLSQLAKIRDGFKDEISRSRLNGMPAVNISVKKRAGENIIKIIEATDKIVKKYTENLSTEIKVAKLMDQSEDIANMVSDLENNIISGLILVVAVLFFVLGFRNAVLVALSIPFSMLISFTVLDLLDITLNMVVLFSLTLALGMLVDNAIVIIENIYRYREFGFNRIKAAKLGAAEVAYPVIGSTLTTLAVFLPMIFWPGIMGEFMSYLPKTVMITLASSLFVALVINPALASIFIKPKNKHLKIENGLKNDKTFINEKPIEIKGFILEGYASALNYLLNHRIKTIIFSFLSLILFFMIWLFFIGLERPVEFFPTASPTRLYVNVKPPEGANIDYIDNIVNKIEGFINKKENSEGEFCLYSYKDASGENYTGVSDIANIEYIYATSSLESGGGDMLGGAYPSHLGIQFIDFDKRKTNSSLDINRIRERLTDITGAEILIKEEQDGPPTGDPINIEISGNNMETLKNISKQIREILNKNRFIEDIRDDYIDSIPSLKIRIDREKAAAIGMNTGAIGYALKVAYNGLEVSTYREDGEDYDITVRFSKEERDRLVVLNNLLLPSPSGDLIPLTSIAKIDFEGSLGDIHRIDQKRVVTIKGNVDTNKIPAAVVRKQVEKELRNFPMPKGYALQFTGEEEEQVESQEFLSKAFVIGIFLMFLILVTIFNSVIQPLIIMTSVVLSLGGVFLGLTVINSPFGIIMTSVGVISLAGVVVNNAIVLIDYTNKLRKIMSLKKAVIFGGATRLRPVLLTAVTTILGLIPMVTGVSFDFHKFAFAFASQSTQYWRTIAIVVIFGLIIATFLTLIVVPVLYSYIEEVKSKFGIVKGKESV